MKKCKKCNKTKEIIEFPKNKLYSDGYYSQCKECINQRNKEYRDKNLEKVKDARKKYYQKNIQKMRKEKRKYYKDHRKEKQEYDKIYRQENKEKISKYKTEWSNNKRKTDLGYKLKCNLRRRIHHALKGDNKSKKTMEILGCDIDFFIKYIESQFDSNMSWDNYGVDGWHIDHIIPCFKFDLSKEEDQLKCFHYTNMRPLWAKDNLSRPRNPEYN